MHSFGRVARRKIYVMLTLTHVSLAALPRMSEGRGEMQGLQGTGPGQATRRL
jgi:hypothetical protein